MAKDKKMKEVNLLTSLIKQDSENAKFSIDSENNYDLALSVGMLYSLKNFNKSKRINRRQLKSMTFLALTNDIQKECVDSLMDNYIDVKGKARKEWNKIITILSNSAKKKENQDENRLKRLFR